MIRWTYERLSAIPAVFIDGLIYVLIAVGAAALTMYSTDDAAKFVDPHMLWLIKGTLGIGSAGVLALKMFRSTAYADHQSDKKKAGNTEHITKP